MVYDDFDENSVPIKVCGNNNFTTITKISENYFY